MPTIPDWFVEELLARTDIVTLIEPRVSLKKSGTNYSACCPFHNEKTPSFVIFSRNQNFHCFGCGAHGDAITFLRQIDGMGYVEAIETLASRAGLPMPEDSESQKQERGQRQGLLKATQEASLFYQKSWKNNEFAAIASDYLKNRGLQGQTAKHYQMGVAPTGRDGLYKSLEKTFSLPTLLNAGLVLQEDSGSVRDRFRARVIFPIRDKRGQVLGFGGRTLQKDGQPKYLNSPETPLFHKGHELYGLYEALLQPLPKSGLIVVEGYMDVVMLYQHGIPNVVASLGTACTREQIKKLFKLTPHITFCFDGDNAGKKAAERALSNVLPELEDGFTVHFLLLPEGHDPDSYVREKGKEAFLTAQKQAMPLNDFLFEGAARDLVLQSPEDKVIFVQNAQKQIDLIRPGLFKNLLLQELSKRAQISTDWIAKPESTGQVAATPSRRKAEPIGSVSLVDRIMAMLLKDATLALQIPVELMPLMEPYSACILKLQEDRITDTLGFVHNWPNPKEQALMLGLHRRPMSVNAAGMRQEFEDALKRLTRSRLTEEADILLKKAANATLSVEEKRILAGLLQERANSN